MYYQDLIDNLKLDPTWNNTILLKEINLNYLDIFYQ